MRNYQGVTVVASLLLGLMCCSVVFAQDSNVPKGWILAGNKPKEYRVNIDRATVHGGKASASMKFAGTDASGFGTLMQYIAADGYRGKRVRLSGYVKTENIDGWVGLWMRIDGKEQGKSLAFDNMQNRAIRGTMDWKKYDVVLDVASDATTVNWGIILDGKGQLWLDDVQLEVVGTDVPTTDMYASRKQTEPANLGFEQ